MTSTDVIKHFWTWFKKNNTAYLQFAPGKSNRKETGYLIDELTVHMRAYCKYLSPEFTINADRTKGELVITANSNTSGFKKADRLVLKAPPIDGWTFIALRPPHYLDSHPAFCKAQMEANITDIWFQDKGTSCFGTLYIAVFVPYILPEKEEAVSNYVDWTILNLIGERAEAMDVEVLLVESLDMVDQDRNLYHIEELPYVLSRTVSKITIGAGGEIQGF